MKTMKKFLSIILLVCMVLGVVPMYASAEDSTQDITLWVGQSYTLRDTTGGYADASTNETPVTSVATMALSNVEVATYSVSDAAATSVSSGSRYMICTAGTYTAVLAQRLTDVYNQPHLKMNNIGKVANQKNVWTLISSGEGFLIQSEEGQYIELQSTANRAVLTDSGEVFLLKWDGTACSIGIDTDGDGEGEYFFNDLGGTGTRMGAWTGDGTKWNLYEVTKTTHSETNITFKAVAAGKTTAKVGNTTYNITVNSLDNLTSADDLYAVIKLAPMYAETAYTTESWSALQTALTTAENAKQYHKPHSTAAECEQSQQAIDAAVQGVKNALAALKPNVSDTSFKVCEGCSVTYQDTTGAYSAPTATDHVDVSVSYDYRYAVSQVKPDFVKAGEGYYLLRDGSQMLARGDTDSEWTTGAQWADLWVLEETDTLNAFYLTRTEGGIKYYLTWSSSNNQITHKLYTTSENATKTYYDLAEKKFVNEAGDYLAHCAVRGEKQITNITLKGIQNTPENQTSDITLGSRCYKATVYTQEQNVYLKVGDTSDITALGVKAGSVAESSDIFDAKVVGPDPGLGRMSLQITALKVGQASIKIGHTKYNIFVTESTVQTDTKDLTMYVGETVRMETNEAGFYPFASSNSDDTVATPTITGGTKLNLVTSIESGHQYYIVGYRNGTMITDHLTGQYLTLDGSVKYPPYNALWTFTATDDGKYTIGRGGYYLNLGSGSSSLGTTESLYYVVKSVADSNAWFIQDSSNLCVNQHNGSGSKLVAGYNNSDHTDQGNNWYLYEPGDGYTDVTFTALKAGQTTIVIGNVTYNITVKDSTYGTTSLDETPIISEVTGDGYEELVTKLTTSVGATFDLGISTDKLGAEPSLVEWSAENEEIATVNENGAVTGVSPGTTKVKATVTYKDSETSEEVTKDFYVLVNVMPGPAPEGSKRMQMYVKDIRHTTVYYSVNASMDLQRVEEGEMIYRFFSASENLSVCFYGAPDEGYALDYMFADRSNGDYCSIVDEGGITEFHTIGAGKTTLDWFGATQFNAVINTARSLGCDGGQGFTTTGTGVLNTELEYNSDALPTIEKTLNGVLPETLKRSDFRRYENAELVAYAGEYVYFEVVVTQKRPAMFQSTPNDDDDTLNSILQYSSAVLEDTMDMTDGVERHAYFYVQEYDTNLNGILDSGDNPSGVNISDLTALSMQDIVDRLNKGWDPDPADEPERKHRFYVVYEIQSADKGKQIKNNVKLTTVASSIYSKGATASAATSDAAMEIMYAPMQDIIVDFGLSVTDTYTNAQGKNFGLHNLSYTNNLFTQNTEYGVVTISRAEVAANTVTDGEDSTTSTESTGDAEQQAEGPQYSYTFTYTPTKILEEVELVILKDGDKNICDFYVHPASTVFYEETFAQYDTITKEAHGWTDEGTSSAKEQEIHYISDTGKFQFGYDDAYESDASMSNGTEKVSTLYGDRATFTFTGTGVEIYGNCTADTGWMLISLYQEQGADSWKIVKADFVNTKTGSGDSATQNQPATTYSTPLFSKRDLPHGRYKVVLQNTLKAGKIKLDGFRVHNTVNSLDYHIYPASEQVPVFAEVRDHVLGGLGVTNESVESIYEVGDAFVDQVYSDVGTTKGVVVLLTNTTQDNSFRDDLLNNGPKNELYLKKGESIVFELVEGVTAQIGLKAVDGQTSYEITNNGTYDSSFNPTGGTTSTVALSSCTDMFYHSLSGVVVVKNNGDKVLSATLIKATGAKLAGQTATVADSKITGDFESAQWIVSGSAGKWEFTQDSMILGVTNIPSKNYMALTTNSTNDHSTWTLESSGTDKVFYLKSSAVTTGSYYVRYDNGFVGYGPTATLTDASYQFQFYKLDKTSGNYVLTDSLTNGDTVLIYNIGSKAVLTSESIVGSVLKNRTVATASEEELTQINDIFEPITTDTLAFAMRALSGEFIPADDLDKEDTTDPTENTTDPTEDTMDPTEDITDPTEDTTDPTEDTTDPTEDTTDPTEDITDPTEDTTDPTEDTTDPTEDTTDPTEDTTDPTEDTTDPTEDTTDPTEDTTDPTEDTTEPVEPEQIENPFEDVKEDGYYYDAVLWAVENGVTTGTTETTFAPNEQCKRAQVVTFLWRAAGEPAPVSSDNPFTDVKEGAYYYEAVLWAVEEGITTGLTEDTFGTNEPCTRAQVVTFLWRAAGEPVPVSAENPFTDVEEGTYYYDAVLWAVEEGITTGMTATTFQPSATCTRGQIVTFLYRYVEE